MSETDLLYGDVEESLRTVVRDLLATRCPPASVLACYDGDRSLTSSLWPALARDLGLAGLLVPESLGGSGASAREAAVVLEELGRAVAPVPFLESAVVATTLLLGAADTNGPDGNNDIHALLASVAGGDITVALVQPLSSPEPGPEVNVDGSGLLDGAVRNVAGALDAQVLLVPVTTGEVRAVQVADAAITPVTSLDATRPLADIRVTGAPSTALIGADRGLATVRHALSVGAALLASEQVGLAQWCLDETVAYLKQRRQFGRIVGGFQALKHRLADLYVEVQQARGAARYAAATLASGDEDQAVATATAQAYCSDIAVHAAEEAIQLHGGIGMTWEHPAHLYLGRAKADQIAFGTPGAHLDRLAELVDLPPG